MTEFVFDKNEMLRMLENAKDADKVAIEVVYAVIGDKKFSAQVIATAKKMDASGELVAAGDSVYGCPKPPGCP